MNIKDLTFKSQLDIQVRMTDLDPFNHVNNGVMASYYDMGRLNYFDELTGRLNINTLDVVLVHTEFDFFESIRFNDHIVVQTKVLAFGEKSIKMAQQIIDKETNKCKGTCFSVLSGYNRIDNCSQKIPLAFKQKILDFESEH